MSKADEREQKTHKRRCAYSGAGHIRRRTNKTRESKHTHPASNLLPIVHIAVGAAAVREEFGGATLAVVQNHVLEPRAGGPVDSDAAVDVRRVFFVVIGSICQLCRRENWFFWVGVRKLVCNHSPPPPPTPPRISGENGSV